MKAIVSNLVSVANRHVAMQHINLGTPGRLSLSTSTTILEYGTEKLNRKDSEHSHTRHDSFANPKPKRRACSTKAAKTYTGSTKDGVAHGYGKTVFPNGRIYEGEYVNGKQHGKGKIVDPGAGNFEGYFKGMMIR